MHEADWRRSLAPVMRGLVERERRGERKKGTNMTARQLEAEKQLLHQSRGPASHCFRLHAAERNRHNDEGKRHADTIRHAEGPETPLTDSAFERVPTTLVAVVRGGTVVTSPRFGAPTRTRPRPRCSPRSLATVEAEEGTAEVRKPRCRIWPSSASQRRLS